MSLNTPNEAIIQAEQPDTQDKNLELWINSEPVLSQVNSVTEISNLVLEEQNLWPSIEVFYQDLNSQGSAELNNIFWNHLLKKSAGNDDFYNKDLKEVA